MYLYYKGIRAGNLHQKSRYTYNILDADLTGGRTFKYNFQVETAISTAIFQSMKRNFCGTGLHSQKICLRMA